MIIACLSLQAPSEPSCKPVVQLLLLSSGRAVRLNGLRLPLNTQNFGSTMSLHDLVQTRRMACTPMSVLEVTSCSQSLKATVIEVSATLPPVIYHVVV